MAWSRLVVPAILIGAVSAPAHGELAFQVAGSGLARYCYEAVRDRAPAADGLALCNRALASERVDGADRVATLINRGVVRLRARTVDAAIADFDAALALDGEQPVAWLNKAVAVSSRDGQAAAAVPMFDRALANRVHRPELAYYGRAMAREVSGDIALAYADYRRAAEIAPQWADPKRDLARFSIRKRTAS